MIRSILRRHFCLKVGDKAILKKQITREEVQKFTQLSGDTNPIHSIENRERAIVHGAHLNSLVSALIGTQIPGPGTLVIAQNLNFPNKCYVDEEVTITVELTEKRKILRVRFVCEVTKRGKIVLFGDAKLVLK